MRSIFRSVSIFFVSAFAAGGPASAGTSNAFTFSPTNPVTALSDPVTYSTPASGKLPALQTYVAFNVGDLATGVLLQNTSGNTINATTITFTATVTDPSEKLTLYKPEEYLPTSCAWDKDSAGQPVPKNGVQFTCTVPQFKNGDPFPAFTVFFVAPTKAIGCTNPDLSSCDKVTTQISLLYAEGPNGASTSPQNSTQSSVAQTLVTLGTSNPVNIKSAVSKFGASVFTGDGGVPLGVAGKKFTEVANVPSLDAGKYTQVEINIEPNTDAQCVNLGNLAQCATYTTSIKDPITSAETQFLTTPLRTIYRVDATNVLRPPSQFLNNVQLLYTGDRYGVVSGVRQIIGTWPGVKVEACPASGLPRGDGLPCIDNYPGVCYKNLNSVPNGDRNLVGDCEFILINTGNGLIKIQ